MKMNHFLVIFVPFLLRAVISQAAPMVEKTAADNLVPPPVSIAAKIPGQFQTVSLDLTPLMQPIPQMQPTAEAEHLQCPAETIPAICSQNLQAESCPQECKAPESDTKPPPPPPPEEPKKKKGWLNGIKNLAYVCYKALSDGLVGEQGLLTLLPERLKGSGATKKKTRKTKKTNENSGSGRTTACCIFYKTGPPVKDDDDENENQDDSKDQAPPMPLNCFLISSKINSSLTPGAPAPPLLAPGSTSHSENNTTSCCCVGKNMFNVGNCLRAKIKTPFNCCAVSIEVTGVDT